jgi:hypothetical protein
MYNVRSDAQTMRALGERLVSLAQQLGHPSSLVLALYWAAVLHHLRREASLTQARAEAAMTLATEQEFLQQVAQATPLRGWAPAVRGHGAEGITQIRLAVYGAMRATRDRPYQLALLVEASAQMGQTTEGLEAVTEALAMVEYRYGCGRRLTGFIGELSGRQRSCRRAVQEFCTSVLGVPISQGAIQHGVDRVRKPSSRITRPLPRIPAVPKSTTLMRPPGISMGYWAGCG